MSAESYIFTRSIQTPAAIGPARHLPNALSALRLALAAAFPLLPRRGWLPVTTVALVTEYLDGVLARALAVESPLGAQLDPVADKAFVLAVLVSLRREGLLAGTEIAGVVARDATVAAGIAWTAWHGDWARIRAMRPTWSGKIATALQFVLLLDLLARQRPARRLVGVTSLVSAVAALDYIRVYRRGTRAAARHAACNDRSFEVALTHSDSPSSK